jgi:hypothetical protein
MTLIDTPAGGRVDRPRIISGRAARAPGEVLLDHTLADFKGVRAGSTLELGTGARRLRLRVVGTGAWDAPGAGRLGPAGGVGVGAARARRPGPARGRGAAARSGVLGRVRRGRTQRFRSRDLNVQRVAAHGREFTDDSRRMLTIISATHRARADRRGVHARDRDRRPGDRAAPPDRAPARDRHHALQATALMIAHYAGSP